MTTLFSLFGSEKDVTKAVDVLTKQVPDVETRVLSSDVDVQAAQAPVAAGSPLPGVTGKPIVDVAQDKINELAMDDEEAEFYLRGLRRGGSLLVVETDKEKVDQVRTILRAENGRWPKQT